jgi:hypothetical protein
MAHTQPARLHLITSHAADDNLDLRVNALRAYVEPLSLWCYLADGTRRNWVTRLDGNARTMGGSVRELRGFAYHLGYTHIKLTRDERPTQVIRLTPTLFLRRRAAELAALYADRPAGQPNRRERELYVPGLRQRWDLKGDVADLECFVYSYQTVYRAGELQPWEIERLELVPGWSWTEPPADPVLIPLWSWSAPRGILDAKPFMEIHQRLYHAGKLLGWKIMGVEAIPGWNWGDPPPSRLQLVK